jgi:hypothetical protein
MGIFSLLVAIAIWNWLGGLVAGLVLGLIIVAPFLARFNADPENVDKARAYCRAVATNHLINHTITTLGTLALCVGSAEYAVPVWLGWTIFGLYFLFWRLAHFLDAFHKLVTGEGLPAASAM